ncbi:endospore germination permease [Paenibacillus qinlingensis]|uniref:Spore germination protein KB n=1 Tax=Paenibacillus qinlingensis TaxID=1837343 RepID=A0ABU1P333_9BACL|nr:endospore germination permease [Paenibacillus qinlingensis]MDR6554148.1 spore germination protein KB [Paenibacillus qinlingensis]
MKISGYQIFWMVTISSIILVSYLPIQLAAEQSYQDCWISILLGSMIMLAITWIMLRVCMQNKDKTLVSFMKDLLGTVIGKIVVILYFLLWFMQMTNIVRCMAEFVNLVLVHNTPMIVIILCMLFLVAYAVHKGGLTTISRCAEIIGPVFVFMFFVQLFLNPQDMKLNRMLPIYVDSGWQHILNGTFMAYSQMVDPSIILMLFFFAENKRTAKRAILWGTALSMLWGLLATLVLLFITGPNMLAKLVTPVYSLTKFISILNFVQNIDAFFIPLWLIGAFVKIAVCLFILSYGLSEWTGFKNWKLISWVMTVIMFVFVIYITHHIRLSYTTKNMFLLSYFYPAVYLVIPLILWGIGSIRNRRKTSMIH